MKKKSVWIGIIAVSLWIAASFLGTQGVFAGMDILEEGESGWAWPVSPEEAAQGLISARLSGVYPTQALTPWGGWQWDVTGESDAALAAEIEKRIYGAVAIGLLQAYQFTGDARYLNAAKCAGNYLKTVPVPGSGNDILQATDAIFLFLLSAISGDNSYRNKGQARMDQLTTDPLFDTGAEMYAAYAVLVNRVWQLAFWIEAGQLYGKNAWADQIMNRVLMDQGPLGGFYHDGTGNYDGQNVLTINQGKIVEVLKNYYSAVWPNELLAGLTYLKLLQDTSAQQIINGNGGFVWGAQDDGSVGGNTVYPYTRKLVQPTAFALAALVANFEAAAGAEAANYLVAQQMINGGWVVEEGAIQEISEYDGETVLALAIAGQIGYGTDVMAAVGLGADRLILLRNADRCIAPVYRFWSPVFMHHFYTISEGEKDIVLGNPDWIFEGVAWYAFTTQQPSTLPVYRFWSPVFMGHFYTISEAEKDLVLLNPDWIFEGVAWYAFTTP